MTPKTLCGFIEQACRCILPEGHEPPHVCDCAGSFAYDEDKFFVYAFPQTPDTVSEAEAVAYAAELRAQGPVWPVSS